MPPPCALCTQGDWKAPAAGVRWLVPRLETVCTELLPAIITALSFPKKTSKKINNYHSIKRTNDMNVCLWFMGKCAIPV